jgi:hypothetical protein
VHESCRKNFEEASSRLKKFLSVVTTIPVANYYEKRETEWKKKCAILNLIVLASSSKYSFGKGKLAKHMVDLILPDLSIEESIDKLPVLKATCLKFIYFNIIL